MFDRPVRLGVALLITLAALPALGATPEQIQDAVKKAQDFLYSKQGNDGTWEQAPRPALNGGTNPQINYRQRQWGGITAICAYALLASGESPQSPKLKPAIDFLQKANLQSTYSLAVSAQVWLFVPETPQIRETVYRTSRMLDLGMSRAGETSGLYTYYTGTKEGNAAPMWTNSTASYGPQKGGAQFPWDLSNSQYGILGMWALAEAGAEVPADYWKRAQEAWEKLQEGDGGWRYDHAPRHHVNPAMTAAGIATLFITQDFTLPDKWSICTGSAPNPSIERGLAWMDGHIDKIVNTPDYYTLYGIERIGVASGHKYFGTTDWFQKGADFILSHQGKDGSWKSGAGDNPTNNNRAEYKLNDGTRFSLLSDTSFAILFLSRGGAPVMMNKLQYESPKPEKGVVGAWNERPRDAANLARWSGRQIEHDLNWQVVNLKVPAEELHDAPILYISGSQPLDFPADDLEKLRAYVEQGGIILGNADCGKEAFAKSFVELGKKLFPKYSFRQLPQQHVIFNREQYPGSSWRTRPIVQGLSNGVRELMLLLPDADAGRAWQTRSEQTKEPLYQVAADIFLYSVDKKHLQDKGDTYIVTRDAEAKATRKIKVARLMVGDNPDPEPGGWRRLAAVLHNKSHIDLTTFPAKPGDGLLAATKIAHLTGTGAFTFNDAARLEIRSFIQSGGTLIVDAAGGSSEFAASAENELHQVFPDQGKQLDNPLPTSAAVYKTPGFSADAIAYRSFARDILLRNARQPRVRGITFGKRIQVFYSREDLSAGLVGQAVDGIYGYEPQPATGLMTAMLLYATGK
ncbi:MAG TPA: DUF4159 domain-containing protein [Tepidisphaeraceae bacterium]|nr:DUF4159 domain-containing protein [Tepidisphaeraceae bacterium]